MSVMSQRDYRSQEIRHIEYGVTRLVPMDAPSQESIPAQLRIIVMLLDCRSKTQAVLLRKAR